GPPVEGGRGIMVRPTRRARKVHRDRRGEDLGLALLCPRGAGSVRRIGNICSSPHGGQAKEARSEHARQLLRCGARAKMASGVVDHADQAQPVLQGRDGDPTS
ncbi:MAG: hypothetical protein ACK55Z_33305, partial [bacterium]